MAADLQLSPGLKVKPHDTSGLPGFPANDEFATAGTPVLAPVSGQLVYVHMIPWDVGKKVGGMTAYLQGDNGRTYFLTHMGGDVPSGRVQAGQPIGVVGTVPGNAWAPHVHEGIYQGIYNPPGVQALPYVPGSAPPTTEIPNATPGASTGATPLQVIRDYAPKVGLDPAAVVAYALTQGGLHWGAVGDNGHSFGPFQMNIHGAAAGQANPSVWANTPQGLIDGMNMMAHAGASGLTGPDAAAYIVGPHFGRGSDPTGDMAKARAAFPQAVSLLKQYPGSSGDGATLLSATAGPGPPPPTQPQPPVYVNPNVPVATAPKAAATPAAAVPPLAPMSVPGKATAARKIPKLKASSIGGKIAEQTVQGSAPIAPRAGGRAPAQAGAPVINAPQPDAPILAPAPAARELQAVGLPAAAAAAPFAPNDAPVAGTPHQPAVHLEADDATSVPDLPKVLALAKMHALDSYAGFHAHQFHRFLETAQGRAPARTLHGQFAGASKRAPAKRDVLFFGRNGVPTHSGISLGGHHFIHGTNGGRTIQVSSLRQEPYASSLLAVGR
jgi:hypothetical protein